MSGDERPNSSRVAAILNGQLRFASASHFATFATATTAFQPLVVATYTPYRALAKRLTSEDHVLAFEATALPSMSGNLYQWYLLQRALQSFDFSAAVAIVRLRTDATPVPQPEQLPPPTPNVVFTYHDRVFYAATTTFHRAFGSFYDLASTTYSHDHVSVAHRRIQSLMGIQRLQHDNELGHCGCTHPCDWKFNKGQHQRALACYTSWRGVPWWYAEREEICARSGGFCSEPSMAFHLAARNATCLPFPAHVAQMSLHSDRRFAYSWGMSARDAAAGDGGMVNAAASAARATCRCTGHLNEFKCSNGDQQYCAAWEQCSSSTPFAHGNWSAGCTPRSAPSRRAGNATRPTHDVRQQRTAHDARAHTALLPRPYENATVNASIALAAKSMRAVSESLRRELLKAPEGRESLLSRPPTLVNLSQCGSILVPFGGVALTEFEAHVRSFIVRHTPSIQTSDHEVRASGQPITGNGFEHNVRAFVADAADTAELSRLGLHGPMVLRGLRQPAWSQWTSDPCKAYRLMLWNGYVEWALGELGVFATVHAVWCWHSQSAPSTPNSAASSSPHLAPFSLVSLLEKWSPLARLQKYRTSTSLARVILDPAFTRLAATPPQGVAYAATYAAHPPEPSPEHLVAVQVVNHLVALSRGSALVNNDWKPTDILVRRTMQGGWEARLSDIEVSSSGGKHEAGLVPGIAPQCALIHNMHTVSIMFVRVARAFDRTRSNSLKPKAVCIRACRAACDALAFGDIPLRCARGMPLGGLFVDAGMWTYTQDDART